MSCALFVADENVLNVVLFEDLVIDRKHGAAGIAEYRVHTLIFQGLNNHPGYGLEPNREGCFYPKTMGYILSW